MENGMEVSLKIKNRATKWSSNFTSGNMSREEKIHTAQCHSSTIYDSEDMHPKVHSSTMYNSKDMKAT